MSVLNDAACVESSRVLSRFRNDVYACLKARADALFELTDALLCDATVAVHMGGMEHLVQESETLGVNTELPSLFLELAKRAAADGHTDDSYAAMIKQFRKPTDDRA
ncbi:imine reductase family protein [Nonomuraea africana]|uniref:3-hydroxyisobutyrate dehydrogenase-like beta-hydroxyacid dehydrogenase n=1 Tax=Nonomuraea africana TaxID=46171 RepID=A0ABR9KA19_9ACTN|nr:hypothetical protein [Nonomuraea africana]MBE1558834.1 3-hydroxyisobutyrate dehydrogenase-like beta-hydroxyacid dehydrogenase [Nonomuraea africana]